MTIKSFRRKIVFLCVVVILALAGWAAREWFLRQEARKLWSVQAEELVALKAKIAQVQAEIARYEKEKDEFQQMLFTEQDVPTFLDSISKYAQDTEMEIQDMKTKRFQSVQLPKDFSESQSRLSAERQTKAAAVTSDTKSRMKQILTLAAMPIAIKTQGAFPALVEFLGYLDGFRQLVTISNVDIRVGKEYPKLQCSFTLTIYSLKTLEELEYK